MLISALRRFNLAVCFLTRIPLRQPSSVAGVTLSDAAPFFGAVGCGVGAAQGLVFWGASQVLPSSVAAVLAAAASVGITGAFHQDGLADVADAFGGGWTVERRQEILKDPRLGTFGVSALIAAFALEVSTVASLDPRVAFVALVAAHTVSRSAAVAVMKFGSKGDVSPRTQGIESSALGETVRQELSWLGVMGSSMFAGLVVVGCVWGGSWIFGLSFGSILLWVSVTILIAGLFILLIVALAKSKISGVNGDVLGAIQQVTYLSVLVSWVATTNSH